MSVLSVFFNLLASLAPSLLEFPPSEIPFTILPIGDSITYGFDSPLGDGFRLSISQHLLEAGYPPYYGLIDVPSTQAHSSNTSKPAQELRLGHRFVGTQVSGTMLSPFNEGHSTFPISRIHDVATPVLESYCQQTGSPDQQPWHKPNVILLLAGTNDVVANPLMENTTEAPARLRDLVDTVTTTCPDAALILAQLPGTDDSLKNGVPGGAARVQEFNDALPGIVQGFRDEGRNISLVDMSQAVAGTDTVDGVHPDAQAYVRMGDVWWEGMKSVLPLLRGVET